MSDENTLTTISVSKDFVKWLKTWKDHERQSNAEQCDELIEMHKNIKGGVSN